MDVPRQEQLSRPLNLRDLSFAWQLDEATAARKAEAVLHQLQSLSAPGGYDQAGFPRRGGEVYRECLEGHTVDELAATYVTLFRRSASMHLLDALTFATGKECHGESS